MGDRREAVTKSLSKSLDRQMIISYSSCICKILLNIRSQTLDIELDIFFSILAKKTNPKTNRPMERSIAAGSFFWGPNVKMIA